MSERTEAPSPRHIRVTRRDGSVAVSRPLLQAAGCAAVVLCAPACVARVRADFESLLKLALSLNTEAYPFYLLRVAAKCFLYACVPVLLAACIAVLLVGLLQTGGLFAPHLAFPNAARLFKRPAVDRMQTRLSGFPVACASITLVLIAWIVCNHLAGNLTSFAHCITKPQSLVSVVSIAVQRLASDLLVVVVGLALMDLLVRRRAWFRSLMRTKTEASREQRELEGDPAVKAARQHAYRMTRGPNDPHACDSDDVPRDK